MSALPVVSEIRHNLETMQPQFAAALPPHVPPARFVRVHRSHIVNLDQVASIEPLDTGDARVHMKDGSNLPCSRTYRGGLKLRYGADG